MSVIREKGRKLSDKIKEDLNFRWKYNKAFFLKGAVVAVVFIIAVSAFLLSESGDSGDEILLNDGILISEDNDEAKGEMNSDDSEEEDSKVPVSDTSGSAILMYIDVSGAVTSPGVVQLPEGSRVFQAIEKAGGLKSNADTMNVNLAAELIDGDKIFVPTATEVQKNRNAGGIVTNKVSSGGSNGENTLININTATSEQLQTLSGVGPSTAQKIIDYREEYGGFKDINDLLNVSGIGEKTLNKFKDKVCV